MNNKLPAQIELTVIFTEYKTFSEFRRHILSAAENFCNNNDDISFDNFASEVMITSNPGSDYRNR